MAKQSLLEKAQSIPRSEHKIDFNKEEIELALAWCSGEVGLTQVAQALNQNGTGNTYAFLARALKQFINTK